MRKKNSKKKRQYNTIQVSTHSQWATTGHRLTTSWQPAVDDHWSGPSCPAATRPQPLVADHKLSICGWPTTSGCLPVEGWHLNSVILLKFFYFFKCFLKLAPTLRSVKSCIFHGDWRFHLFWKKISKILSTPRPSYLLLGFFVHEKLKSQKIPQDLLVLWKLFVPFLSAGCICICSTYLLPLRFGTQVPNMMCMTMLQKLKVA